MTFKIKYLLSNSDTKPHFKYLKALNKTTAVEILKNNLIQSGYEPEILSAFPVHIQEKDRASQI